MEKPRHPALPTAPNAPARRRPPKPEQANGPWLPAEWDKADATALQALAAGSADAVQQKRALGWIVERAAGTYDMSYRPGASEGDRDTAFAEGKRSVGNQIVKLLKVSLAAMARQDDRADQHEPQS